MQQNLEELTRALDRIGSEKESKELNEGPQGQRLARSLQKGSELKAFIKKESSLAGWSDNIEEPQQSREETKRETVRVTGFNIVDSPTISPLIRGKPGPAISMSSQQSGIATAEIDNKRASAKVQLDPVPKSKVPKAHQTTGKNQGGRKGGPGKEGDELNRKNVDKAQQRQKQKQKQKQKKQKQKPSPRPQKKREQKSHHAQVSMQYDDPKRLAKFNKHRVLDRTTVEKQKKVPLFSHLPQYEGHHAVSLQVGLAKTEIHPAILRLGVKFAEGAIVGSTARCMAMLTALKEAVKDFKGNEEKEVKRSLMDMLKPIIQFVAVDCRPMSPGMGNAIRYIKSQINNLPLSKTLEECKELLLERINSFILERIDMAGSVIARDGAARIGDGDVVMTYARSRVVEMVFLKAKDQKKSFRVILVDSRPKYEGKALCKRLVAAGVNCTYILLNGLSFVMKEVTRVMIGASSILTNGTVLSRVGTAVVGMMAKVYNIPVIVCCESYKFHERVQVSSISFNELGDPEDLVTIDKDYRNGAKDNKSSKEPELSDWRKVKHLKLLNLVYDLTPAEYISLVITEVGQIPVTSVPVVLREYMKYSTT